MDQKLYELLISDVREFNRVRGSEVDLRSANLRSADLSSANLRLANLSRADLYSANLSRADLRSADLRWADLRLANLRGTKFFYEGVLYIVGK